MIMQRTLFSATMLAALACRVGAADEAPSLNVNESDVAAIRQAINSYIEAYNLGDAPAVADHWREGGEWISPSGSRVRGKEAIQAEMELYFQQEPGTTIEVVEPTLRFLTRDVAVEEGTVKVRRPKQDSEDSTYIAIHVRSGDGWKLDSVRETSLPDESPPSPELKDLDWLVGRWIDQSPDATLEAGVIWTKNKTFLNWSFKLSVPGMDDLEGTQVIGWDPRENTIRSWMFDSDGGFGGGTWSRQANRWMVEFSQVLPDGRVASARNIYTRIDDDTYTWKSTRREVDGEPLPDIAEVTVVRQPTAGPDVTSSRAKPSVRE
jgi:uncharacterized protein (TIGR02246 family)